MKLILLLLLILYFHCSFQLEILGGGDPLRDGTPEDPFFAGRGRRSQQGRLYTGERDLSAFVSGGLTEERQEHEPKLKFWQGLGTHWDNYPPQWYSARTKSFPVQRVGTSPLAVSALNDPSVFYIWYNIRKKQENAKQNPDELPFVAMRG